MDFVTTPEWEISLPASAPGELYRFGIQASGASGDVGIFTVDGWGWYGWRCNCVVTGDFAGDPSSETWRVLPPVRDKSPRLDTPMKEWCAYGKYPTRAACMARLAWYQGRTAYLGFAFAAGRCVPASEGGPPRRHDRVVENVVQALRRAVGDRGIVGPPQKAGERRTNVAVRPADDAKAPPSLIVGVAHDPHDVARDWVWMNAMALRGIPEAWLVEASGADGDEETIYVGVRPGPRGYRQAYGSSPRGPRLALESFPGVSVGREELVPPLCP